MDRCLPGIVGRMLHLDFSPLMPLTQALGLQSSGLSIVLSGPSPSWAAEIQEVKGGPGQTRRARQKLDGTTGASGVLGPIAKTWEQSRKEGHAQGGVDPPTSPGEKLLEECKL